jgi:hypothetical protein
LSEVSGECFCSGSSLWVLLPRREYFFITSCRPRRS